MRLLHTLIFIVAGATMTEAATVAINWSVTSDPTRNLLNKNSIPLSAGTSSSGDGTLVQLGYYTLATLSNPFRGSWVPLASSTMGDDGVNIAGKFSTTTVLGDVPFLAPSVGTPLAVRFFDGPSVAGSTYFNAVSNETGSWNFVSPTDPTPTINIVIDKASNIVFQNDIGVFSTQIAIPEPSSLLLVSVTLSMTLMNRRRIK